MKLNNEQFDKMKKLINNDITSIRIMIEGKMIKEASEMMESLAREIREIEVE